MIRRCLALLAVLCLVFAPARAADWPEFRGPTGQGLAEGTLPVEWGKEKNVVWKKELPGAGWSSPVVVNGRIYLTAGVSVNDGRPRELSLQALCLDSKTGKLLWSKEVFRQDADAPAPHSKNSHASPTPLVHDGRLYVHFGHQGSACLDLTGKLLWRNNDLKYAPVHGNGGSPILVDDKLIFNCDGGDQCFVAALYRKSGKLAWKTERNADALKTFSFSTPLLITVKGKKQVVSAGSGAVMAYDPGTGKEIWRVRYGDGYSVIPRPVHGRGLVFISTGYMRPSLLAIRPDGEGDVTDSHVAWTVRRSAPHTPSPLLVGDELYMVSDGGVASCLDAKTGKLHWEKRVGGNFSASPLYADGKIYLQSEEGVGLVLKTGKKYEQIAKNPLEERTLASYAAADGALYIRTAKLLYKFQTR
jgi:outer membrane protein assembly factor BamB